MIDRDVTICAVDPGSSRSGVVLMHVPHNKTPALKGYWEVTGGPEGFLDWWQHRPAHDVLVVEDYIVRKGVPSDHKALRTVGFLRATEPEATFQMPAGRKKAVSNDALKRLGLYLPGEPLRNAVEAARHAVLWLKNQGHRPTIEVGWPDVE